MLKDFKISIIFILIVCAFQGCYPPPEFPETPEIEFEDIWFREGVSLDTLNLTFAFQDGDGDLGLDQFDVNVPYHDFDTIIDKNRERVFLNSVNEPPFYRHQPNGNIVFFSETDNRPEYSCLDYIQINVTDPDVGTTVDTLYIALNERHKNIFVDFYIKRGGVYSYFDWNERLQTCGQSWDGRFPIFEYSNLNNRQPIAGSMDYAMTGGGIVLQMLADTFQLRVTILDRAGNYSNELRTPDFTLPSITRN